MPFCIRETKEVMFLYKSNLFITTQLIDTQRLLFLMASKIAERHLLFD